MQEIMNVIGYGAHTEAAAAIASYSGDINAHNGFWWGSFLMCAVLHDNIPAIEALAARGDVDLQAQTASKGVGPSSFDCQQEQAGHFAGSFTRLSDS